MKKLPEFIALGIGLGCLGLAGAIAATTIAPPPLEIADSALSIPAAAPPAAQHAALVRTPGR